MIVHQIKIKSQGDCKRISELVLEQFKAYLPSKSSVKKAFKKQLILLNGNVAKSGDWLTINDTVSLTENQLHQHKSFLLNLEVLFEDEYMAVINKPAGYPVSGNFFKTIQNALNFNLVQSTLIDALNVPRPVHRLDKLTSGILIIAKTRNAQISLGNQFELQNINKTYYALVKGKLEGEGEFNSAIEGLSALTSYKSVRAEKSLSYEWVSLVELKPKTGRTHQLRIHLATAGHPIIGDYIHDDNNVLKGKGLFLSACKIEYKHPETKECMLFELPLPSKFDSLMERELNRWGKFNC